MNTLYLSITVVFSAFVKGRFFITSAETTITLLLVSKDFLASWAEKAKITPIQQIIRNNLNILFLVIFNSFIELNLWSDFII